MINLYIYIKSLIHKKYIGNDKPEFERHTYHYSIARDDKGQCYVHIPCNNEYSMATH